MLKLGVCSYSFHRTIEAKKMSIEEIMKFSADKMRIGGFELLGEYIPSLEKKDLMSLKKLATSLHLTIPAISAPFNNFAQESGEKLDEEIKKVKDFVNVAYDLGTPILKLFAAWAKPEDKEKLWPNVVKGLKECAGYAQEKGITLTIEPHNHGGFPATADDTIRLLKDIDSPYVRLLLDIGNYIDDDIYQSIEKTIPFADYLHAKIHKITDDEKELEFDYERIFKIIKSVNYRGFICVEYEGEGDELTYIPKSVNMVRKFILKYA